jgi:hypothetical protein
MRELSVLRNVTQSLIRHHGRDVAMGASFVRWVETTIRHVESTLRKDSANREHRRAVAPWVHRQPKIVAVKGPGFLILQDDHAPPPCRIVAGNPHRANAPNRLAPLEARVPFAAPAPWALLPP